MSSKFNSAIDAMHDMYGLPKLDTPTKADIKPRLTEFVSILGEEFEELEAIIEAEEQPRIDTLVDLADFLGDVVVYCASEARRHGIPIEQVLEIIMDSNLSKLGADGLPIFDHRGKIQKGPNYWKPEPKIKKLLMGIEDKVPDRELQKAIWADIVEARMHSPRGDGDIEYIALSLHSYNKLKADANLRATDLCNQDPQVEAFAGVPVQLCPSLIKPPYLLVMRRR